VNGNSTIRFSVFELDLKAGELRRNGSKIRLQAVDVASRARLARASCLKSVLAGSGLGVNGAEPARFVFAGSQP